MIRFKTKNDGKEKWQSWSAETVGTLSAALGHSSYSIIGWGETEAEALENARDEAEALVKHLSEEGN